MIFKHEKVWNEPLVLISNLHCFNDTVLKTYGKHVYFLKGLTNVQNMSEVNTSALRGSLEKCFAEQHDIANGSFEQWCFDQQQNDLKQLMVQYEDLEARLELIECFYARWDANQEENVCNVEKLEKRVTKLEEHLRKLEDRVEIIDEGDDKRLDLLEERVAVLNTQNIELRNHLNLTVDMLNNVTRFLNNQLTNKEQTNDATQVLRSHVIGTY